VDAGRDALQGLLVGLARRQAQLGLGRVAEQGAYETPGHEADADGGFGFGGEVTVGSGADVSMVYARRGIG
jgi:hypothetical protein